MSWTICGVIRSRPSPDPPCPSTAPRMDNGTARIRIRNSNIQKKTGGGMGLGLRCAGRRVARYGPGRHTAPRARVPRPNGQRWGYDLHLSDTRYADDRDAMGGGWAWDWRDASLEGFSLGQRGLGGGAPDDVPTSHHCRDATTASKNLREASDCATGTFPSSGRRWIVGLRTGWGLTLDPPCRQEPSSFQYR
jgi:hypothetical protein